MFVQHLDITWPPQLTTVLGIGLKSTKDEVQVTDSGRPLGFYRISTTKKNPRISTKYRPHSTLSTKYRPQKFLEKRTFTIFTFKSWDIHILGKWGLSWNMRDKWGLFQLRTFRKALYMDHTALCRPYIQTIIETSIKVYVLNLKIWNYGRQLSKAE